MHRTETKKNHHKRENQRRERLRSEVVRLFREWVSRELWKLTEGWVPEKEGAL